MLAEQVFIGRHELPGDLLTPAGACGIVVFAHGSGSSRRSPRNIRVAQSLQRRGLGTLLFDLLSEPESAQRANVFDIALLAGRVKEALRWVREHAPAAQLPIGLFGASTGAAAALLAAAERPEDVSAVVSRGGRPDLAGAALPQVRAPTLLIVGENDPEVFDLNRAAYDELRCTKRLDIVPRATHLFEEAGTLEVVAALAADWFATHLAIPLR
jgi:pimeloyl-ACP methyl ester carboxylesterase